MGCLNLTDMRVHNCCAITAFLNVQFNFLPCKTFCLFNLNFFVLKNPKSDIPCEAVVCCVFSHLGNKGKLVGIHSCPLWVVLEDNCMDSHEPTSFLSMKMATLVDSGICAGRKCEVSGPCFLSHLQPSQGQRALQVHCPGVRLLLWYPFSSKFNPRTQLFAQQPAIHLLSPVP